ncbi:MAG: hypothetical protein AAF170_07965 [Bacteroidota bacterium]
MRPAFLLVAIALCLLPLALGLESLLLVNLPGGLPLGTLLAALAFILGAAVPVVASRPRTLLRWVGMIGLVAAVLWLPLGMYLSGTPSLSFVNDAADSAIYWGLTKGLAAGILATMLWAGAAALFSRQRPGERVSSS